MFGQQKIISDNAQPFIILYYPKYTKTVTKLGEYEMKAASYFVRFMQDWRGTERIEIATPIFIEDLN
mgnify:CR=1 FL=1